MVRLIHMILTPLGNALQDKIKGRGPLQKQIEASQVIESAQKILIDIFGPEAQKTKPLFLKNRTLTITCDNSVIAQEVRLHQEEILDRINEKIGKKEVDRIRYLL